MFVLLLNQRAESVFRDAVNVDLACDHVGGLKALVAKGFDDAREVFLEVAQYCVGVDR